MPTRRALNAAGYDGVEVPIFGGDPAYYRQMRWMLEGEGLMSTVVTIVQDEARYPLSAVNESAGVDDFTWLVDRSVALGAEVLAGPFYQPLGVFSGHPLSDDEWHRLIRTQTTIAAAKAAGYDGWLTVGAFGHALPDIAAATRVWRPLFTSTEEVYTEAITLISRGLAA